ncbi:RNA-directed DNA polymerase, eukaryota, reverse transcriptase zinc-binding domain protein [Tanacetum coccineum]
MNTCTSFISALLPTASPHDCNVQKSKMGDRHIGTSSTIGNTLLEYVVREEDLIPSIDKKRIVDETMRTKKVISNEDMVEWSHEMKRYFKDKKELFETAIELEKDENVLEVNKGEGAVGDTLVLVKIFLEAGKNLSVMEEDNNKGCRIKWLDWNPGHAEQYGLLTYTTSPKQWKLWKELENQKSITNGNVDIEGHKILKGVLGKLVHESQSAFVAGRQITDNILLSQELFRGYNRKQKQKKVAFKIDLQKAYDTISWEFLKNILLKFGFPSKMVNWIMTCVSTTKFSISINGDRVGYFQGGRGLRQGDPMSPYLFTLVMEVLNLIVVKNIEDNGDFKYHYGCKKLKITHLCFADDLLMFCHGDGSSVETIRNSLEEFSNYSGLKANMNKSTVFFGGMTEAEQRLILDTVPFPIGRLPVRYLGVPLITKKISATDCKPLVEKVRNRVMDWRNRSLSYAGRVQLIESVLSSMHVYWASVFLLPKNVIYEINKILKGFLWCQGIKQLLEWNEVLLTRQLWKVASKEKTLWVKWINTERLKGKSIWMANAGSSSSAGWKDLLKLRDKVRDHVLWKIGDGTKVSAWNDRWDSLGHLSDTISSRDIHEARLTMESTLAELVNINNGAERVFGTRIVWKDWSYYGAKMEWYPVIWYNMNVDGMKCSLCQCCMDSIEHLFFMCPYTNAVWGKIQKMLNVQLSYVWHIIVDELIGLPNNKNVWSIVRRLVFGAAVYFIWQERNRRMIQNEKREVKNVAEIIKETVRLKLASFVVKNGRTVRNVEAVWGIKFYRKV